MATLCFSPPLSLTPLSPTIVSYFSGSFSMTSARSASLAASLTSSKEASGLEYLDKREVQVQRED